MIEEFPFIIAIDEARWLTTRSTHALLADRLEKAGFDVGPMAWTAAPGVYSAEEIRKFWHEAFIRAGIEKIEQAHDRAKQRFWFRVWRTKQTTSPAEPNLADSPPAPPTNPPA